MENKWAQKQFNHISADEVVFACELFTTGFEYI